MKFVDKDFKIKTAVTNIHRGLMEKDKYNKKRNGYKKSQMELLELKYIIFKIKKYTTGWA